MKKITLQLHLISIVWIFTSKSMFVIKLVWIVNIYVTKRQNTIIDKLTKKKEI